MGRLDQNSGFHGNRKSPLTYNGENNVSDEFDFWPLFSMAHLYVLIMGKTMSLDYLLSSDLP